jgi:hypothetical protein
MRTDQLKSASRALVRFLVEREHNYSIGQGIMVERIFSIISRVFYIYSNI